MKQKDKNSPSSFTILPGNPEDYTCLCQIWEQAVRQSHDFLSEEDIQFYAKAIQKHYLPELNVKVARSLQEKIVGFVGWKAEKIEMLFVHPDYWRQGVGRQLLENITQHYSSIYLDVNEDNPKALSFYLGYGFKKIGYSETDQSGKPFPLHHLKWERD